MHSAILLILAASAHFLGTAATLNRARQAGASASSFGSSPTSSDDGSFPTGTDSASPSQSTGDEKVEALCFPVDDQGNPRPDAPCNQVEALQDICSFNGNGNFSDVSDNTTHASPADQQKCYCSGKGSMFFQLIEGCFNCERLHGADPSEANIYPVQFLAAQSSSYCAQATPSANLEDYISSAADSQLSTFSLGTDTGTSDVFGTSTDISLYYTSSAVASGSSTTTTGTASTTNTGGSTTSTGTGTGTSTASGSTASPTTNTARALEVSGALGVLVLGVACML